MQKNYWSDDLFVYYLGAQQKYPWRRRRTFNIHLLIPTKYFPKVAEEPINEWATSNLPLWFWSSHKFKLKLKHGDFSGALAISKNSSNRINLLKVVFVSHPLHPNQPVSKKFKVEHSKKYVGLQEEAKLQVQFKKVSEIFK